MANCEKILLAGFSGAGKSSLLGQLKSSAPKEWSLFQDLDALIFSRHADQEQSLSELIENIGWERFRELERSELFGWLAKDKKGVLALGGGTLNPKLLEDLKLLKEVKLIYLHADFETCWLRLNADHSHKRPLLKKGKDFLHSLYEERSKVYQQIPFRLNNPPESDLTQLAEHFWSSLRDH